MGCLIVQTCLQMLFNSILLQTIKYAFLATNSNHIKTVVDAMADLLSASK